MRRHKYASIVAALMLVTLPATAAVASGGNGNPARLSRAAVQLGRQALGVNDGWAASATGTTGGSAATPDRVFVAHNRAELVAALGGDNATNKNNATAKIIYIAGTIDGFEADDGTRLGCADLADPAFSLEEYLATYDPAVWGRVAPSGPLEDARARSVQNQTRQTQINVGPNTTVIGLRGAKLTELTLMLDGASNSIVRNVDFSDAHDCFPAWTPTDGATGNWNSQYDTMSVRRSTNVWVDHNRFSDGANPDSLQPVYFGRPFQTHDGSLDITHTSDLVTVSYNRFRQHDKTMLIGSSDNPAGGDPGRLRVTLHHNAYDGVGQRAPRVRFGQVDIYNNLYRVPAADGYSYSWGVGVQSAIYAENNYFVLGADVAPDTVVHDWGGTVITERGTWVRQARGAAGPVNLLATYNASHDPDLGADAGWTPALRSGRVLPTPLVPVVVELLAGAGRLPL